MTNLPAVQALTQDLATQQKNIASMLPPGMDPKRFMRTTVNAISTHAQSEKLLKADRQSLFNACQKAAADGLLLDSKEATLVVFSGEVAYMPMVQGLVKLARNSGEIGNISYAVVYKNDEFEYYTDLDGVHFIHKPLKEWEGDRGAPVAAFCLIALKDSDEKILKVLTKSRIMAIAQGGKNAHQYTPGKGAHFEEWWGKTVIKNALKYAPKSTFLESALANDNEHIDPDQIPADYIPAQQAKIDTINSELGVSEEVDTNTGEIIDVDPSNPDNDVI